MRIGGTILVAASVLIAPPVAAQPQSITALSGTVKIKARAHHHADPVGLFRAGQTIALREATPVGHAGCKAGWYAVAPRGFVCATKRVSFDERHPHAVAARAVLPADRAYPYQYAKVTAPTWRRTKLLQVAADDDPLASYFARSDAPLKDKQNAYPGMKVAWARELQVGDVRYVVTPELHLIRKDHLTSAPSVLRRSVWLTPSSHFPFAMPLRDTFALDSAGTEIQAWPMTALVPLARGRHRGGVHLSTARGERLVRALDQRVATDVVPVSPAASTADDAWLRRTDVAVFGRRARPAGVGERDKWIHVRINSGSLVAYEGDDPVFAAVISPGMHGAHPTKKYATPTGRYRISNKHLTSDMGGAAGVGTWRSRAVPWVSYFHEGYALHGAWWHDRFGRPHSHGCVNLTPGDARTIFHWSDPQVPPGWYAVRADAQHPGTVVVISP